MKKYKTKEQCIEVNGEHAWKKVERDFGMSCAVDHLDGHCSYNDPQEECWHCPAVRTYSRTQAPVFEWIES